MSHTYYAIKLNLDLQNIMVSTVASFYKIIKYATYPIHLLFKAMSISLSNL
jgi:hypothetical protein